MAGDPVRGVQECLEMSRMKAETKIPRDDKAEECLYQLENLNESCILSIVRKCQQNIL